MRYAIVLLIATVACSNADTPVEDAGSHEDAGMPVDVGPAIDPPQVPDLPAMTPCPAGWRELSVSGTTVCDPWPETGVADCTNHEAHYPGQVGCARVGAACPTGDFPEGLPTNRTILYVKEGSNGNGSEQQPFGTINAALQGASAGTIIAVGKGRYDEVITLRAGITLQGTCVEETLLTSSVVNSREGVVNINGRANLVRDLRIEGRRPGLWVDGASATVTIEGVVVVGVAGWGLFMIDGAVVTATDFVIRDTVRVGSESGRGVEMQYGGSLQIQKGAIEGNLGMGFFVLDPGSALLLEDVVVRDTTSEPDGTFGNGLSVLNGAQATVRRSVFQDNKDVGIFGGINGAHLDLEDVVLLRTEGRESDGLAGRGLSVERETTAVATRVYVSGNRESGINVSGNEASLQVSDVVVTETLGRDADDLSGRGLNVQAGGTATVTRGLFRGNRSVGVIAVSAGTQLTLSDITIEKTESELGTLSFGTGLWMHDGAQVTASRISIDDSGDIGLRATGAGVVGLVSDLSVERARGRGSDGLQGRAINVETGSTLSVLRADLNENREVAIYVLGGSLHLSHTRVRNTLPRACATTSCSDFGAGIGIGAYESGIITAEDFAITQSTTCGLHIAQGGQIDLSRGEISANAIGACIEDTGYNIDRLSEGVLFLSNDTKIDAPTLPVPEGATPHEFD